MLGYRKDAHLRRPTQYAVVWRRVVQLGRRISHMCGRQIARRVRLTLHVQTNANARIRLELSSLYSIYPTIHFRRNLPSLRVSLCVVIG